MAPRSGVRGVTVEDVANVAQNGSSSLGGYTFTRSQRPTRSSRFAPIASTNVQDLISGMIATPLNTAGQRYSGYPTASAQEAAILGSIEPFYEIGDYARQLADMQYESLVPVGRQRARGRADLATSAAQQLADAQAQVDAIKAGAAFVGAQPGQAFQPSIPNQELLAQAEADRDLAAYGAAMAARNQIAFAQPRYDVRPETGKYGLTPTTASEALIDTMEADIANLPQYRTQVAPLEQMAADIQAVPRYQLAQQMATQYFGMDPALAAGMFTPQVDIDYMDMMVDYQAAQNLARGIDPNASTEDILLSMDPSGQRLIDYQETMAEQAERKLYEGARTAEEEAFDLNIEVSTGYNVKQAAGNDFALSTAREYLDRPGFVATVNKAVAALSEFESLSDGERKIYADNLAAQYMAKEADPVGARILLNILYGYTFTIPITGITATDEAEQG